MIKNLSLIQQLLRLWGLIDAKHRQRFRLLLGLMTLSSLAEIISIGALLPFLSALSNAEKLIEINSLSLILNYFEINNKHELVLITTFIFCLTVMGAGFIRLVVLNKCLRFAFDVGAEIANSAYSKTLSQPYEVHIERNSSELITGITTKINEVIFYVIVPSLTMISSLFIVLSIVIVLIVFVPSGALFAILVFGLSYGLLIKSLRLKIKRNSEIISTQTVNVVKHLQEGLSGIRSIIIDGTHISFLDDFKKSDIMLRNAQRYNLFVAQSPRFFIETAGMILVAIIALYLTIDNNGFESVVPALAVLALGLQRMMPALQQSYQSWSLIQGAQGSLVSTINLLLQKNQTNQIDLLPNDIEFRRDIVFKDISFGYKSSGVNIIKDFDLVIPKGARVGVVGKTGSGKSTLMDLLMGLLQPTSGYIFVDGVKIDGGNIKSLRNKIAHVPQDIYLKDGSILENIAFGKKLIDINYEAAIKAAHLAQISTFIETLSEKYNTQVGERGVQLSGGQRQRIGIARALYKNAEIIILDEATSSLDTTTENSVMQSIEGLSSDITIIIIAHRLSTLSACTNIVDLRSN